MSRGGAETEIAPLAKRPVETLTTIELRTELRALGQNSAGSEPDLKRRLREFLIQRAKEDAELAAAGSSDGGEGSSSTSDSDVGASSKKSRKKKHKKKKSSHSDSRKKDKSRKKKHGTSDKKHSKKKKKKRKQRKKRKHGSSGSGSSSSSSDAEKIEEKTYDANGRLIVVKKKKISKKRINKGKRWSDKLLRWIPKDRASESDSSDAAPLEDMDIAHPILKRARHKLFGQGIGV
eukprot:INCI12860.1.p1 GENE.INCI12860.1~~INCI12860.1.p1  ORF type:complete len:234 (-),score=65.07 INCI12860.1:221-922(-)